MRKQLLLITGMHRSGTSLMARLLNLHGVFLPLHSDYKDEFNERGYWESFEVQKINDELFRFGDSSWFDARKFSLSRQSDEIIIHSEQLVNESVKGLLNVDSNVIAIKDPRICRLIPIWVSALENNEAKVLAITPYRNPLEVAASLKNRDGFNTNYCLTLWLRNVLEAELDTRKLNRVFCSYDDMLSDWPSIFLKISEQFQLSSLTPFATAQAQVNEFISGSLKHWSFSASDLKKFAGADSLIYQTYQLLQQIDQNDTSRIHAKLDVIREKFNKNLSISSELEYRDLKITSFTDRVTQAFALQESKAISFKTKLKSTKQDIVHIKSQMDLLNKDLKVTKADSVEYKLKIDVLGKQKEVARKELNKREDQITKLEEDLVNEKSSNRQQANQLSDLQSNLGNLTKLLLSSEETQKLLDADLSAIRTAFETQQKKCAVLSDQLGTLEESNNNQKQEIVDLSVHFQNMSEAYQAVVGSISWKITRPLRALVKYLLLLPVAALSFFVLKIIQQIKRLFSIVWTPSETLELVKTEKKLRKYVPICTDLPLRCSPVKLIAFYLPQFHPIPENDEWWGQGFTEWVKVKPAKPQFRGHYQPRVPDELGYYNLRDINVQRRQIELAKLYGVGGFCFYFYWFHGTRLLEAPMLQYLENRDLNFPFCLCWANENWSRTWDGLDSHVLIGQEHSKADDIAFINYLSKYLVDKRYIRVNGKPLLLVYRPNLLPDAKETANRWREWCRRNGVGEIFIAYTQSFETSDPTVYGFDAAVEFPPNNTGPEIVTEKLETLNEDFSGFVYDWTSVANRSQQYSKPEYPLLRAVNPSWDNTARRKNTSAIFVGSTPEAYEGWLEKAAEDTMQRFSGPSERLVFVNAWNEWAEGAYLEPDKEYGYAYLRATRNALLKVAKSTTNKKIILVAHDAHPHGAQYLALNIAKMLSSALGFEVDLVVLGGGILIPEYEKWARVHQLDGIDPTGEDAKCLVESFVAEGHQVAICNTTVSGHFLVTLSKVGIRCVALIHELKNVIIDNKLETQALAIASNADRVVFPAKQVLDVFQEITMVPDAKIVIRYQGLYKNNSFLGRNDLARNILRKELGLSAQALIVLGVGFLDHRKGVDLFVEAGFQVLKKIPNAFFVWVGHWEVNMEAQIKERLKGSELADRFIFPGRKENTDPYYAGADVFVLASREDPFPTTVMEALEVSVPVIGFSGAGGFENLLKEDCGVLVPLEDIDGLAKAIVFLLKNPGKAKRMGERGAKLVLERFSFRHYLYDLLDLTQQPLRRISAVVPNYNYARHLEQRLASIFSQTYPVFEVIVLDDASTDNSIEVIEKCLAETDIDCRIIKNEKNSGSVFKQWQTAVESSRGDFVWICEADDFADPKFVERTISLFEDKQVVLGYSQSRQVGEDGEVLNDSYLDYTNDISTKKWKVDYICNGPDELANVLAIKNTIPNVSAVIFRKKVIKASIVRCQGELQNLRIAGDWLLYSDILQHGRIGFISEALNSHRRHDNSVTINALNNERHVSEIKFMQNRVSEMVVLGSNVVDKAKSFERHAIEYLKNS